MSASVCPPFKTSFYFQSVLLRAVAIGTDFLSAVVVSRGVRSSGSHWGECHLLPVSHILSIPPSLLARGVVSLRPSSAVPLSVVRMVCSQLDGASSPWECVNCKYRHTQEKQGCLGSFYQPLLIHFSWRPVNKWLAAHKDCVPVRKSSGGSRQREAFAKTYVGFFSLSSGDSDWWHLVSPHLSFPWFSWYWGVGEISTGWAREGRGSWCGREMRFLTIKLTMSVFSYCTGMLRATLLDSRRASLHTCILFPIARKGFTLITRYL